MWILIAALPVGMFLGLVAGGTFAHLREIRVRGWVLAVPALAIVALMAVDRDPPAEWLLLPVALALFAIVAFRNMAIVGMSIVGVGVIANLVPVLVNGEMPVSEEAVIQAGLADETNIDLVRLGAGRRFEETGDVITFLGAIVPVEPVREVLTFGDLIVIAGLVNVGFRVVKPTKGQHREEQPAVAVSLADAIGVVPRRDVTLPAASGPGVAAAGTVTGDETVLDLRDRIGDLDDLPTVVEGSATWGD